MAKKSIYWQKYCPTCTHYDSSTGACSKLHFNISSKSNTFKKKCGGDLYEYDKVKSNELKKSKNHIGIQKYHIIPILHKFETNAFGQSVMHWDYQFNNEKIISVSDEEVFEAENERVQGNREHKILKMIFPFLVSALLSFIAYKIFSAEQNTNALIISFITGAIIFFIFICYLFFPHYSSQRKDVFKRKIVNAIPFIESPNKIVNYDYEPFKQKFRGYPGKVYKIKKSYDSFAFGLNQSISTLQNNEQYKELLIHILTPDERSEFRDFLDSLG